MKLEIKFKDLPSISATTDNIEMISIDDIIVYDVREVEKEEKVEDTIKYLVKSDIAPYEVGDVLCFDKNTLGRIVDEGVLFEEVPEEGFSSYGQFSQRYYEDLVDNATTVDFLFNQND